MSIGTKHIFFHNRFALPLFTELLEARADVRVDRLTSDSTPDQIVKVLGGGIAYHLSADRHEIPTHLRGNAELIARAPNLLVISSSGAGYDTIDVDACTAAGVLAVNQAGGNREAVAEHALGMMLALCKRIVQTDRHMRREAGINRGDYVGTQIRGKTIGIVGLGNVGRRVAELCHGLFGMQVLAYDPYLNEAEIAARSARKTELEPLLRQADIVSIHCPRTAETLGMIGANEFARMKPTCYFINTARGGIHDERALAAALESGALAGAGLDVWDTEPPPIEHPLLRFDNVIATPHIAGVTFEAREEISRMAVKQLLDIVDGRRPPRLINSEVWPAYAERFHRMFGFAPE